MGLANLVERSKAQKPRKQRLMEALREVNEALKVYYFSPAPTAEGAYDCYEMELRYLEEARESLLQGSFPESGFEKYVVDGDYECGECYQGHRTGCEALDVNDLHDCLWKSCRGCCPNGCPEHGLARHATIVGQKFGRQLSLGHDSERWNPAGDEDLDEVLGSILCERDDR